MYLLCKSKRSVLISPQIPNASFGYAYLPGIRRYARNIAFLFSLSLSLMSFRFVHLTVKRELEEEFYEILQRNTKVSLRSGQNDSNGVSDHKVFDSVELASRFVEKTVAKKRKQGFEDISGSKPSMVGQSKSRKTSLKHQPNSDDVSTLESTSVTRISVESNLSIVQSKLSTLTKEMESAENKKILLNQCKQLFIESANKIITVNAGGTCITVRKELGAMHSSEEGLFALISGKYDHLLPKDKNGRMFLDLDAKWVEPLINLARDMSMWDGIDELSRPRLNVDPLYHQGFDMAVSQKLCTYDTHPSVDTTLFPESEILRNQKMNWDNDAQDLLDLKPNASFKLIFRGSRDGFTAAAFHAKCDGHKNTISIIHDSKDCVFGGFMDIPWIKGGHHGESLKAFLFSLKRNGVVYSPAKKFVVNSPVHAAWFDSNKLCCFGGGCDLTIDSNCDKSTGSYCNLGYTYDKSDFPSLANQTQFRVNEIEVFELVESSSRTHTLPASNILSVPEVSGSINITTGCPAYDEIFQDTFASISDNLSILRAREIEVKMDELLPEAIAFRDELRYVAKFAGIELPCLNAGNDSQEATFEGTIQEIEAMVKVMSVGSAQSSTTDNDASSIVTIKLPNNEVLAVSKATLLQAPAGAILANFTSDVWGHDLDSDGNIVQDVNPELFRLIIAHLRLKALLQREGRLSEVPPISVYEDQKAAMTNLLAFYAMSEVPLKLLKKGGWL